MRELISVLLLCSYPVAAQEIILPPFAVEDEPVSLQATDLAPGRRVILEVERTTQDGARAISRSEFQAGGDGRIDPALTAPISGYEGIDASGPFWSMVPQRQSSAATERGTLSVRILDGKEVLAESRIPLRATSPGVVSEDIGAFPGARLYRPAGPARVPVIVVLGGSEGGTYFGRFLAPKLAARGYAALALPYYNSGWGGSPIVGADELPGYRSGTSRRGARMDRAPHRSRPARDWRLRRFEGGRICDARRIALSMA